MDNCLNEQQRSVLDRLLRTQLLMLEQSLVTRRAGLSRREHARSELVQDPHDLPQRDGDYEVEAGLSQFDTREHTALTNALQRLHGPDFGRCIGCKAQIPFDRLVANPRAVRCIACATAYERPT
jgi:DnaK suppressor protein